MLRFLSLASGSSGNCYYLGTNESGILIDAGIPVRSIKKGLKEHNIAFEKIMAVLITHDHADHIRSVGTLGEKYAIPVYTTSVIHDGINRNYSVTEKIYSAKRTIFKNTPFELCGIKITAFEVPHDGTDNVGYFLQYGNIKFAFATDLGHISKSVHDYLIQANYLIIEANYDEEMLRSGSYPYHLKERIRSANGHLSNRVAGEWLAANYHSGMKHIFLCHLSKDNNHPELAYKTIELHLRSKGVKVGEDLQLTSLRRNNCSDPIDLVE